MVAAILSRITIVLAGILYPAYSSFKAVRRKSHKDYTKWMMYWIVFAIFMSVEVLTDTFLSWLPLYYEVKILFVLWLVLPITEGSKQLYRYAVHPFLLKHEKEMDRFLSKAGETGMSALRRFSRAGINIAATTVVTSAMKGQAVITETLLRAQEQPLAVRANGEEVDQSDGSRVGGADFTERDSGHRPSTASSNESEPFEVIDPVSEELFPDSSDAVMGRAISVEALDGRGLSSSGYTGSSSSRMTFRQSSVPIDQSNARKRQL